VGGHPQAFGILLHDLAHRVAGHANIVRMRVAEQAVACFRSLVWIGRCLSPRVKRAASMTCVVRCGASPRVELPSAMTCLLSRQVLVGASGCACTPRPCPCRVGQKMAAMAVITTSVAKQSPRDDVLPRAIGGNGGYTIQVVTTISIVSSLCCGRGSHAR